MQICNPAEFCLLKITGINVISLKKICQSSGTGSPVSDVILNHYFFQKNVEKLGSKVFWISTYQPRFYSVIRWDCLHTRRYTHAAHCKLLLAGFLQLLIHDSYISPHTDASHCIPITSLCTDMCKSACRYTCDPSMHNFWDPYESKGDCRE